MRAPCGECPWRRSSCAGWVGTIPPEEWVRAATSEARIDCHVVALAGQGSEECAGAAIYRANIGKRLRDPNALALPADRVAVFSWPDEFIAHHRSGACSSDGDAPPPARKKATRKAPKRRRADL
jgi:hypothetical protein